MQDLRNLVVATDFSPGSHAALIQGWRMASHYGATLHYLHVIPKGGSSVSTSMPFPNTADAEQAVERQALEYMQGKLEDVGATAQSHVRFGRAVSEIKETVKSVDADLLVIGATGENNRRWGAVSSRCVRHGPRCVLLVPAEQTADFKRILACVDLTAHTTNVLKLADSMAAVHGSETKSVHCFEVPWERARFGTGIPTDALDLSDKYRDSLQKEYESLVPQRLKGAAPTLQLVQAIEPEKAIVNLASQWKADLVVTGTTGRTGFAYMLLGTTAEKIMRDTTCAVLSLKSLA